jgi:hypothetical protein
MKTVSIPRPESSDVDYVYIHYNETYCVEPVGRQGGEQHILIFEPECGYFGFYLHACMQMLGFYHEHSRLDRDNYVDVLPENIMPGMHGMTLQCIS